MNHYYNWYLHKFELNLNGKDFPFTTLTFTSVKLMLQNHAMMLFFITITGKTIYNLSLHFQNFKTHSSLQMT